MKIGIDIRIFGTRHGGIGRYCQKLVPEILKLSPEDSFYLFSNQKAADPSELEELLKFRNATIVETGIRHYSLKEQVFLPLLLNKYNLDLVHFTNFNAPIFYKRPFVVTIHDMVHHKISGAKKSRWAHFFAYKNIIGSAAKKAAAIITVSEKSKNDISLFLKANPEKIFVSYEGASLGTAVEDSFVDKIKKQYLLNRPYFLFVGVLERKKNLITLARAFDLFLKKYKADADLVIAGKADSHYPDIRKQAMKIKFSGHLVFTGYVPDRELEALYKGAYCFVSASLHEGFGLPGVEALRFGLPLAVSNTEVFNEIYDNAAIYFDPLSEEDIAEKLHLIARDEQFHIQMQKKAFQRSLLFDWQKTAVETIKAYKKALNLNL